MTRRLLAVPLAAIALLLTLFTLTATPAAAEGGDPHISAEVVSVALPTYTLEGVVPNPTRFTEVTAETGIAGDFITSIPILGAVANGKYLDFEAPFDMEIRSVSARAVSVTNPADGDVTVDILDDGVSILTDPLSIAVAATTYKETDLSAVVAAGSIVKCSFALSGSAPALADTTVAITARRHFT